MKFKTRRTGQWTKRLKARGKQLNRNQFASEVWFKKRWKEAGFPHKSDRWNAPVGYFIADMINRIYGYVIEIDGGIHDTIIQKQKDMHKDAALREMGLTIVRVKAFSESSFLIARAEIGFIRMKKDLCKK